MRIVRYVLPLVFTFAKAAADVILPADWAFQPVRQITPPAAVAAGGSRHPIDAFIIHRLQANGLQSSPQADRRTLIRRLTFDLHGLPPTPDEIDAFEKDGTDEALENLIDRLLVSPRYGERWARHWLDIARFSESQGFERDKIRPNAWRYRDYVIDAFNNDLPYDRFMREQVAGDVLDSPTRAGIVATGFLVAGPFDEVGSSQKSNVMRARVREEDLEDIVSVVGQSFLGVTVNCSRCHDHKFDPIPQRDYYSIKAVFEGIRHGERSILTPADQQAIATRGKAMRLEIARAEDRLRELEREAWDVAASGPMPFARWSFESDASDSFGKLHGRLIGDAQIRDGRLVLDGDGDFVETPGLNRPVGEKTFEAWVAVEDLDQRGGGVITLEERTGRTFDALVYGESESRKWIAGSDHHRRTKQLAAAAEAVVAPDLVHLAVVYSADRRIALYRNGRPYGDGYQAGADLPRFLPVEARILLGKRHTGGGSPYFKGMIEEARLYDRALSGDELARSFHGGPNLLVKDVSLAALSAAEQAEHAGLARQIEDGFAQLAALENRPLAYAANPRKAEPTYFLKRGEVLEKGELMTARGLAAVAVPAADLGLQADSPEAERRRRFANWLTHSANPLPARVMMNRVWQHHFGVGLVDTPSDFGASGSRPSHPDLLDWLAGTFIREGWSLKSMHRLILTSATYLQSSAGRPAALGVDADNRWLWRHSPRRLEAEAVRDSMLAVAGTLNLATGGPGYRPFELVIDNTHFYLPRDKVGPEFNRRTIYRIGVQSLRDPVLDSLDCPDLSTKTPVRGRTTTPIQALALMNDSFVQRQAADFAGRLRREAGEAVPDQVNLAVRLAFGRAAGPDELGVAGALIEHHGLAQFCWALLNANEFIHVQ